MISIASLARCCAVLLLMGGLVACGGKSVEPQTPSMNDEELTAMLIGKVWVAESIQGDPVADMTHTSMVFNEDGSVRGRGGCNTYAGRYTLANGGIMFSPLAATMKMCVPALEDQEERFFKAMEGKQTVWFENGLLHLSTGSGPPCVFAEHKQ